MRRRWVSWVALVALTTVVAGCGAATKPSPPAAVATALDQKTADLCDAFDGGTTPAGEKRLQELLAEAPPELREPATVVFGGSGSPQDTQVAERAVTAWFEVRCHPQVALPGAAAADRRFAPPVEVALGDLRLCSAGRWRSGERERRGGVRLYGETSHADPYDGPMLGVVWGSGDHGGDGPKTQVRVRGTEGVAAPITVFQQAILPELGTVIAWREGGLSVGLYGRRWGTDRIGELVALADSLVVVDGGLRFPPTAMPAGHRQVYEGVPQALQFIVPPAGYQVRYRAPDAAIGAMLSVTGSVGSNDDLHAVRFLSVGLNRRTVGGREMVVGEPWRQGGGGPVLATWREPDGVIVRVLGMGPDLAAVEQAAATTRELSRPEWIALVEGGADCPPEPAPPPRPAAPPLPPPSSLPPPARS